MLYLQWIPYMRSEANKKLGEGIQLKKSFYPDFQCLLSVFAKK